VNAKKVIIPVA